MDVCCGERHLEMCCVVRRLKQFHSKISQSIKRITRVWKGTSLRSQASLQTNQNHLEGGGGPDSRFANSTTGLVWHTEMQVATLSEGIQLASQEHHPVWP